MSLQEDADCDRGEFDWIEQIPLDQLELLEWLLGSGLRNKLGASPGTEQWERGWKLVDAIACHKERFSGARKD